MVETRYCEFCGLPSTSFKNKKAFNNHFESHKSNLICKEPQCNKTFDTRDNMRYHRRTAHASPVNCQCSGRYCDIILKNLDKVEEVVGAELLPIVATMRAFGEVIRACFGKVAKENYKECINKFENCWNDIWCDFDINFTNKAHIIISHVPQVIERTGRGLFNQSEEVVEAAHAKLTHSGDDIKC